MKLSFVGPILAALILATSAANARADEVQLPSSASAPTTAATAVALPGVHCVLRTANGQTQFRRGETIHLVASFTSDRPGYKITRFVRDDRGMATLGAVKVTPADGVTDPIGELPPPTFLAIAGYVPPPVALGEKPVEFPFVLNDWARFDKTGVYQVTLTTSRVFVAKPDDRKNQAGLLFNSSFSASITSQPLQIEITPADEAWANEQIEITREFWRQQASSSRYAEIKPPQNDISFLGTRAAMTAIIEHLSHNPQPRESDYETHLFRTGFIGFPDRDWLIGAMKRALAQPNYAVTTGFFDLLTDLQSLKNAPRPAGADANFVGSKKDAQGNYEKDAQGHYIPATPTPAQQLQIDWEKRRAAARNAAQKSDWLQITAATPAKTAAPRAMTLHTLLGLAWQGNLEKEPQIKAQLPQLVAQLAPIFDQLPSPARANLLGYQWDKIKSPAFVPALQRSRQLPIDKNDYDAKDANDLALKRLAEIAPQVGRAQLIAQIKSPKPSVNFETLSSLPDATLPALDDALAANYENSDSEISARLIERYASAAILPRVRAHYESSSDRLGYGSLPAILAYFVRVNPGYGIPKVAVQARIFGKRDAYSSLLLDVATLQSDPRLESVAIANLTNAGEGSATDAAQTLGRIGSPAAEGALLARLKNTSDAKYPRVRGHIEWRVVEALAGGQGWLCPPAELRQIRALCLTEQGRNTADDYLQRRDNQKEGEPLHLDYSPDGYWGADGYNGRGMNSFRAKLAQFPRGTTFRWQKLGSGPAADQAFETTRQWAAARGLKIEADKSAPLSQFFGN